MTQDQTEESIPWVEKYRPTNFDDIVLDPFNRTLFEKIMEKNYFPNLLFYGPPGTGKTTTIINLIQNYQMRYSRPNKSNVIHLNASDERGIDIIRNQIYSFVRSMNLFETGLKFVILDEVDYMTKNAQHALKYLLQTTINTINSNVRFILICNYISKIDDSLQNEFICVRFNQLPKGDIYEFIRKIAENEGIQISDTAIDTIQTMYQSDIRSMINFLQLNQNYQLEEWNRNILNAELFEKMRAGFLSKNTKIGDHILFIHKTSIQYNIDKKHIIHSYLNYVIRNYPGNVTPEFLNFVKECIHNTDLDMGDLLEYFCLGCIRIR